MVGFVRNGVGFDNAKGLLAVCAAAGGELTGNVLGLHIAVPNDQRAFAGNVALYDQLAALITSISRPNGQGLSLRDLDIPNGKHHIRRIVTLSIRPQNQMDIGINCQRSSDFCGFAAHTIPDIVYGNTAQKKSAIYRQV